MMIVATKDTGAFGELVRRHQGAVRALLRRLARDPAEADDLAQDAFCKAFERIGSFRGEGTFRSWVCGIAYREFLQAKRRARTFERILGVFKLSRSDAQQTEETAPPPVSPEAGLDLESALARLGEKEREAIVLCDACGFSHGETAEAMKVPLGTVKSYVKRGREKLRGLLDGAGEPLATHAGTRKTSAPKGAEE